MRRGEAIGRRGGVDRGREGEGGIWGVGDGRRGVGSGEEERTYLEIM